MILSILTPFAAVLSSFSLVTHARGLSITPDDGYHVSRPQTILSFQGIYGSNFNETITFCNFRPTSFELHGWNIIPAIARLIETGESEYNEKGALLYGGVYQAPHGSITWKGLGFSANGPFDAALTLEPGGGKASGYYTFLDQENGTTPGGETGPWVFYYRGQPTEEDCEVVFREHKGARKLVESQEVLSNLSADA